MSIVGAIFKQLFTMANLFGIMQKYVDSNGERGGPFCSFSFTKEIHF